MKPIAYKKPLEALNVARCGGGIIIGVSGTLCEDGQDGFLVATDDHRLWDVEGRAFYVMHSCLRLPKDGEHPGKWALALEECDASN